MPLLLFTRICTAAQDCAQWPKAIVLIQYGLWHIMIQNIASGIVTCFKKITKCLLPHPSLFHQYPPNPWQWSMAQCRQHLQSKFPWLFDSWNEFWNTLILACESWILLYSLIRKRYFVVQVRVCTKRQTERESLTFL